MAAARERVDFVIDTSAVAKLFLDEPESGAFRAWYVAQIDAGATFGAPFLLGYEVAHLLARNLRPPAGERAAGWLEARFDEAMAGIALDEGAARAALAWADGLTVYDASYLAAAASAAAGLVTYDAALARAAKRAGVETRAPA